MFDMNGNDNSTYNVDNFEFIKKTSPVVGGFIVIHLLIFCIKMLRMEFSFNNKKYYFRFNNIKKENS